MNADVKPLDCQSRTAQVRVYLRLSAFICGCLVFSVFAQEARDPFAWGSTHAGKPVPEYITGDECLFCHRNDIGPGWQKNRHGTTVRQREDAPELAARFPEGEFFLGSRAQVRLLKKQGYGKFAMFDPATRSWNAGRFADRCAGCHSTGVDAAARTFSAFGLDCYTCHGVVSLDHTKGDFSTVRLSKKRRDDARTVTSICAQCHLRGGASRSTRLPYPNNFVPGDNLFRDFAVDFANADDAKLNPGDRHVWRNVREVVLVGNESVTCVSCHRVHGPPGSRHRLPPRSAICWDCHQTGGPFAPARAYTVRSELCEY